MIYLLQYLNYTRLLQQTALPSLYLAAYRGLNLNEFRYTYVGYMYYQRITDIK